MVCRQVPRPECCVPASQVLCPQVPPKCPVPKCCVPGYAPATSVPGYFRTKVLCPRARGHCVPGPVGIPGPVGKPKCSVPGRFVLALANLGRHPPPCQFLGARQAANTGPEISPNRPVLATFHEHAARLPKGHNQSAVSPGPWALCPRARGHPRPRGQAKVQCPRPLRSPAVPRPLPVSPAASPFTRAPPPAAAPSGRRAHPRVDGAARWRRRAGDGGALGTQRLPAARWGHSPCGHDRPKSAAEISHPEMSRTN